jgi:hypothetical protein
MDLQPSMTYDATMAKKRRNSVPLEEFLDKINHVLATDQSHSPQWRQGLSAAIREGLALANNYGGWEFTDEAGLDYKVVHGEIRPHVEDRTRRRFFTLDEVEDRARETYEIPLKRETRQAERIEPSPPDSADGLDVERLSSDERPRKPPRKK